MDQQAVQQHRDGHAVLSQAAASTEHSALSTAGTVDAFCSVPPAQVVWQLLQICRANFDKRR